jgi:hypothetical protein
MIHDVLGKISMRDLIPNTILPLTCIGQKLDQSWKLKCYICNVDHNEHGF